MPPWCNVHCNAHLHISNLEVISITGQCRRGSAETNQHQVSPSLTLGEHMATIQLVEYAIPTPLFVKKIRMSSSLNVFIKHGTLYSSKSSDSIFDYLTSVFPKKKLVQKIKDQTWQLWWLLCKLSRWHSSAYPRCFQRWTNHENCDLHLDKDDLHFDNDEDSGG